MKTIQDALPLSGHPFTRRHIGPGPEETQAMLSALGYTSLDALIEDAIPSNIRFRGSLSVGETTSEFEALAELRTLAAVATGKAPGPESSILKVKGTELQQAIDALFVDAAGYYALPYVPEQYEADFPVSETVGSGTEPQTSLRYFNNRKASIYGGSNEIQKNIISKHVLGL